MVYRPLLLQVILSLLLVLVSKSFTENFVYLKPFTFDMVGKRISSVAHSQIAIFHEEGYSSREIAGRLSLVQSTVVRSLKMSQRTAILATTSLLAAPNAHLNFCIFLY